MLGKIVLTLAVIIGAYLVIRARMLRGNRPDATPAPAPRPPLLPAGAARALAYGLVSVMVAGSLMWLYLDWEKDHEIVAVQVINANTGVVTDYRARRQDVEGRQFTTLDGRRVTLADVERLVLESGGR
jgi:hypothetical protein